MNWHTFARIAFIGGAAAFAGGVLYEVLCSVFPRKRLPPPLMRDERKWRRRE